MIVYHKDQPVTLLEEASQYLHSLLNAHMPMKKAVEAAVAYQRQLDSIVISPLHLTQQKKENAAV